jgi:signal transduction histidine kinase
VTTDLNFPPAAPARMGRAFQRLQDLSIRRKLTLLLGLLALGLVTVLLLAILGLNTLSQVRAYVGGEGLWAKAQKDALYSLAKYAHSRDDADYQAYLRHLEVPLGDRAARLELSKPHPDLSVSDRGFLQGHNHPEDVRGMATLFLRFHRFELIHRAIVIWTEADAQLLELQGLGARFHSQSAAERAKPAVVAAFLRQLDRQNEKLTALENAFSFTMGEAARWAKRLLTLVMLLGALGAALLSLGVAVLFSRHIARGVTLLGDAASKAAQGDLSVRVQLGSADELGRLAHAFNAMARGLARIEEVKNSFVSNVSHELRTPLTLVLAPLESLLAGDSGPIPPAQLPLLQTMDNNARRLLQMVNGLLDFSKLQAGKMPVNLEPLDVVGLTESIARDFGPTLKRRGLDFQARLDPARPTVLMDAYLYERILFNLLSNAAKFTLPGGGVQLSLDLSGGRLKLQVRDSGIGISEEDAGKLFQKFSQAEASSTRRFEGTGLGLALVKECAQLLGGDVSLQSAPGRGSVFTVDCPAAPAAAGLPAPALPVRARALPEQGLAPVERPAATGADLALPRVLVAEDNPELAAFISALLEPHAQVRILPDGAQALEEARRWLPDLVLSDVMMPAMDGVELTRRLKTGPDTAGIPVVLLTALTGREDLLRGWDAGADDYLFKPFHPRELQARVRSLLAMVAWRRRSEQVQKRQEVLEQFTRIASHDLRAPLRRIASYAGLMLRDSGEFSPQAREHLQVIAAGAGQMNNLIESLLKFARLDAAMPGLEPCDLNGLMGQLRDLLAPDLAAAQGLLELSPLPELPAIPGQMFALFHNLLSNSLKYAQPGRPARVKVDAQRQGGAWLFTVADNGIGFEAQRREEVFVLFKRLHQAAGVPGEGMGLAIAKKIVELHGGRIWAESEPGRGCTIYFTLLVPDGQ